MPATDPDRVSSVRQYLLQKALSDAAPAAVLNLMVMADGKVHIGGIGIEPEHAECMLEQIDLVRDKLQQFVNQRQNAQEQMSARMHRSR